MRLKASKSYSQPTSAWVTTRSTRLSRTPSSVCRKACPCPSHSRRIIIEAEILCRAKFSRWSRRSRRNSRPLRASVPSGGSHNKYTGVLSAKPASIKRIRFWAINREAPTPAAQWLLLLSPPNMLVAGHSHLKEFNIRKYFAYEAFQPTFLPLINSCAKVDF
jgi:hypothetical protein